MSKVFNLLPLLLVVACNQDPPADTDEVPGEISVDTNRVDMGEVEVLSVQQGEVVVTNNGEGRLHFYDVNFDNDMMRAHWVLTGFTSGWMDPGESKTLRFTLYPRELGDMSTTVTLVSNDPALPEMRLSLLGESYGVPEIKPSDSTLTWDDVVAIGESAEAELTLGNIGNDDLTITSVEVTEGEDVFSVTVDPSGGVLAPGDTNGLVVLSFAPDATGPHLGNLRITSDDPETPTLDVALSGSGTVPD